MGCHWRNLAVTYVLHYIWWGVGKDLSFSMDWYGCFMYKTHSEILFAITLYGTVCPLYKLLPFPHAWGKSDHNLHYKPHHQTLYHHITLQYHKWSQQNCETNEPEINSQSMPKFVGFHPCPHFLLLNVVSGGISHLLIPSASQKDIYDHSNSGI